MWSLLPSSVVVSTGNPLVSASLPLFAFLDPVLFMPCRTRLLLPCSHRSSIFNVQEVAHLALHFRFPSPFRAPLIPMHHPPTLSSQVALASHPFRAIFVPHLSFRVGPLLPLALRASPSTTFVHSFFFVLTSCFSGRFTPSASVFCTAILLRRRHQHYSRCHHKCLSAALSP